MSMNPGATTNPIGAIESEMILLEAVRGDRVDPYFAYRLGVLGKLVARICSPLERADSTYRNLYYADVDKKIENVPIDSTSRRVVDPQVYLPQVSRSAADRADVIVEDYKTGLGFGGVAQASLSEDASRLRQEMLQLKDTLDQAQAENKRLAALLKKTRKKT